MATPARWRAAASSALYVATPPRKGANSCVTITILGFALAAGVMPELPSSQQNAVALPNQKSAFTLGLGLVSVPERARLRVRFLMNVTLTENDVADLKEGLRRCSPETIEAAIRYRERGD